MTTPFRDRPLWWPVPNFLGAVPNLAHRIFYGASANIVPGDVTANPLGVNGPGPGHLLLDNASAGKPLPGTTLCYKQTNTVNVTLLITGLDYRGAAAAETFAVTTSAAKQTRTAWSRVDTVKVLLCSGDSGVMDFGISNAGAPLGFGMPPWFKVEGAFVTKNIVSASGTYIAPIAKATSQAVATYDELYGVAYTGHSPAGQEFGLFQFLWNEVKNVP